jgi:hypothetical protein
VPTVHALIEGVQVVCERIATNGHRADHAQYSKTALLDLSQAQT